MVVSTEDKQVQVEIIDRTIPNEQENRIRLCIKMGCLYNFAREQKPATVIVSILVADFATFMALEELTAHLDLSTEN